MVVYCRQGQWQQFFGGKCINSLFFIFLVFFVGVFLLASGCKRLCLPFVCVVLCFVGGNEGAIIRGGSGFNFGVILDHSLVDRLLELALRNNNIVDRLWELVMGIGVTTWWVDCGGWH